MVRRFPSPKCPPTGRAVGVRHPRAVGAGVWLWGPNTVPLATAWPATKGAVQCKKLSPWLACPVGAACRGGGGGVFPGGAGLPPL